MSGVVMHVVVADGDATVRGTLQAQLHEAGYLALTAADVEMLVALLLATITPLVVLLDAQLPGLTGYEALEILLQADDTERRRVYILMTQGTDNPLAYLAGDIPELGKPFSTEVLLEAVARAANQLRGDQADYSA